MNNTYIKIPKSKLIILYFFNSIDFMLSEHQTIKYLTGNEWANYFDIQEHLVDLIETQLLFERKSPNGSFFSITDTGTSSIEAFKNDILLITRNKIDDFIYINKEQMKLESTLFSDYMKIDDNEYRVSLKVLDDTMTVFEQTLFVYSKQEAELLINNWLKCASDIYKYTYTELMKP